MPPVLIPAFQDLPTDLIWSHILPSYQPQDLEQLQNKAHEEKDIGFIVKYVHPALCLRHNISNINLQELQPFLFYAIDHLSIDTVYKLWQDLHIPLISHIEPPALRLAFWNKIFDRPEIDLYGPITCCCPGCIETAISASISSGRVEVFRSLTYTSLRPMHIFQALACKSEGIIKDILLRFRYPCQKEALLHLVSSIDYYAEQVADSSIHDHHIYDETEDSTFDSILPVYYMLTASHQETKSFVNKYLKKLQKMIKPFTPSHLKSIVREYGMISDQYFQYWFDEADVMFENDYDI